jgi:hypothetical protein
MEESPTLKIHISTKEAMELKMDIYITYRLYKERPKMQS